ncbi:hypothetical protein EYD10_09632 [Varanus komodoensis]|nr:hypothetical protein EYD10_09632 [Varanus komodoensis]
MMKRQTEGRTEGGSTARPHREQRRGRGEEPRRLRSPPLQACSPLFSRSTSRRRRLLSGVIAQAASEAAAAAQKAQECLVHIEASPVLLLAPPTATCITPLCSLLHNTGRPRQVVTLSSSLYWMLKTKNKKTQQSLVFLEIWENVHNADPFLADVIGKALIFLIYTAGEFVCSQASVLPLRKQNGRRLFLSRKCKILLYSEISTRSLQSKAWIVNPNLYLKSSIFYFMAYHITFLLLSPSGLKEVPSELSNTPFLPQFSDFVLPNPPLGFSFTIYWLLCSELSTARQTRASAYPVVSSVQLALTKAESLLRPYKLP